jgi:Family of unknown function (DUF6188)
MTTVARPTTVATELLRIRGSVFIRSVSATPVVACALHPQVRGGDDLTASPPRRLNTSPAGEGCGRPYDDSVGRNGLRHEDARWARWWQETGEYELRQILHWKWDPIGVAGAFPYAANEYDRYAPQIASALKQGVSAVQIAAVLAGIEHDRMDLPEVSSGDRRTLAEGIVAWYESSQTRWVEFGSVKTSDPRSVVIPGIERCDFSALNGLEVQQIWIWWSLRLVFDLGYPGVVVDLTDFRFTDAAGARFDVRTETDPVSAGPVLSLLHHRVRAARVEDSTLTMEFDNSATIACPPRPHDEAWSAWLPGGTPCYCPPGGFVGPSEQS